MIGQKIYIYLFLILSLIGIYIGSSFADDTKVRVVTKNYQLFFPIGKYPEIEKLYDNGVLQFTVHTNEEISIIKKQGKLVFYSEFGFRSQTGSLEIRAGERRNSIPLEFIHEKSDTDFSIVPDMYKLTLQEKSLSCESAASSDILSTILGQDIDEDDVITELPKSLFYNKLPENHPDEINIWGNPNIGFVGHIDHTDELSAKQKLMTGYGVYEAPIAEVYKKYGLETQIVNGDSHTASISPEIQLRFLLEKLKRGSMVQLWGDWCTREEYDDGVLASKRDFYSRDIGTKINAKNTCYNVDEPRVLNWKYYGENGELVDHTGLDGEHAFILLGWKGNISNPTHISVWDTDTGYHEYQTHEWMRKWKKMNYRSLIILKNDS